MTEYMIPAEPAGPLWGKDGTKWEKSGGQFWNSDGNTKVPSTWNELLQYHSPLRDYPPEPAHGTRWVDKSGRVFSRNGNGWTIDESVPGQEKRYGWWRWAHLWEDLGPLTEYVEPEPVPDPEPWENVKPGRLYWVTGRDNYRERRISSIAFGATINGESVDYLSGDGWALWRAEQHTNRLQSAVELTAIPTHLLDELIETAVDYDDPEDGTSISREALHDLTDWLADHPQNKEKK